MLLALLPAALLAGPPAAAQVADGGPRVTAQSLPTPANRVGPLRRDRDGRIVPAGPPAPADGGTRNGVLPPYADPATGEERRSLFVPRITRFDPAILDAVRSRAEHEMRARRVQTDVDRIVGDEREAKRRGAPVDRSGLTAREAALVAELRRIDSEVRAHEMDHYYAGQPWARFPEYFEVTGPLGRRHAVSGITPFDASAIAGDRPGTLRKLETLQRAALAPREPSDEDRRVAAALEQLIDLLRQP